MQFMACPRWACKVVKAALLGVKPVRGLRLLASLARSVKAVPVHIITVGKGNSNGAELMAAEWAAKLRR